MKKRTMLEADQKCVLCGDLLPAGMTAYELSGNDGEGYRHYGKCRGRVSVKIDLEEKARDEGFFGGLLTACICINHFDEPVIIEEIMGTLGEESKKAFIQFAKDNGEYELAGLGEYEEFMRSRQEGQEDAS